MEIEFEGDDIGWGQRLAGYAGAGAGGALGAIPLIKKPWKAWAVGSVGAAAGYEAGHALTKKRRRRPDDTQLSYGMKTFDLERKLDSALTMFGDENYGKNRSSATGQFKDVFWDTDLPATDASVIRSGYRKARKAHTWGQRAHNLAKDTSDHFSGKPRERDSAGREKKREWEKSWFKNALGATAVLGGGLVARNAWKNLPDDHPTKVKIRNSQIRKVMGFDSSLYDDRLTYFDRWDDETRSRDKHTAVILGSALGGSALIGTGIAAGGLLIGKNNRRRLLAQKKKHSAEKEAMQDRVTAAEAEAASVKKRGDEEFARMRRIQNEKSDIERGAQKLSEAVNSAPERAAEAIRAKGKAKADAQMEKYKRRAEKVEGVLRTATPPVMRRREFDPNHPDAKAFTLDPSTASRPESSGGIVKKTKDRVKKAWRKVTRKKDEELSSGLRPRMLIDLTRLSDFEDVTRGDIVDANGRRVLRYTDVRGKSARIHRGDSRPRERREKEWWEREENKRKLALGGMALAGGAGILVGRSMMRKQMGQGAAAAAQKAAPAPSGAAVSANPSSPKPRPSGGQQAPARRRRKKTIIEEEVVSPRGTRTRRSGGRRREPRVVPATPEGTKVYGKTYRDEYGPSGSWDEAVKGKYAPKWKGEWDRVHVPDSGPPPVGRDGKPAPAPAVWDEKTIAGSDPAPALAPAPRSNAPVKLTDEHVIKDGDTEGAVILKAHNRSKRRERSPRVIRKPKRNRREGGEE